ncbi:MAG: UDP-N-acetylglucosamine-transferase, partial [Deltaproteobacteria bacterium]|nr:UDP-N-acetylglucosamine-transferase [Deltaproteobacteria bacterium]
MENAYPDSTMFVQIASYRDKELLPTLKDMLEKADRPELLHVCICWQHHPDDKWDNLDEYKDNKNFNILDINSDDSQGACWARHSIQQHYKGEDFTFQLDSHHRFINGWDTDLKNMYAGLELNGSEKPLI